MIKIPTTHVEICTIWDYFLEVDTMATGYLKFSISCFYLPMQSELLYDQLTYYTSGRYKLP